MAPIMVGDNAKDYPLAPEGLHQAVCVDVVDQGVLETTFGKKHKVDLIWQIVAIDDETGEELLDEEGSRFRVLQRYTASLNPKSLLHKHLVAWRGRAFTADEAKLIKQGQFDIDRLVGANCQLQIVHAPSSNGQIYANVQTIVPPARGANKIVPLNYERKAKRDAEVPVEEDSDIPF